MAEVETPERSAIRQHFKELQSVITKGSIPASLFQHGLIFEDTLEKVTNEILSQKQRATITLLEVLDSVRTKPALFDKLCDALEEEDVAKDMVPKLKGSLRRERETHPGPSETAEFQKLRIQLEAFHSTQEGTTDERIQQQTFNCSQHLIQRYIENELGAGTETSKIKSDLERLSRFHQVIPRPLLGWGVEEVDKVSQRLLRELRKVVKPVAEKENQKPLLFSKETIYHASLCCEAIDNPMLSDPLSFFRNKKPRHNLTEVSFSQSRAGVTPYLVARQKDVVYVAFKSIPAVSQWLESSSSFDEGLALQSCQIPLCFFMDELLNNKRIVLTGFSFGGMLACCICAKLWHNTMADQDVLTQDLLCITFGQPLLPIKMVEDEISLFPLFEQAIHCVYCEEDPVPLTISCLRVDEKMSLLHNFSTAKAIVGPSDPGTNSPSKNASEPVKQFDIPFVKEFLQNLSVLQEHAYQSEMKPKVVTAIKMIQKAFTQLGGINPLTLYGSCYVMSKDEKMGVVWQQPQTKQLAALELGQHLKMLTSDLFAKHSMEKYIPLMARSYLEKDEKYVIPNTRQSRREVAEVDALKPNICGPLKFCDYPNERVVVLQGENLWFSYKVTLDDNGPAECEFNTPAEKTTQFMIEFRADVEKSSDFGSRSKVKLTLYTHFASPIRQTVYIEQESRDFSMRQMQLAKHTPSQVIKLAYLCALLEQRYETLDSKRFIAIAKFLEKAVQVVPIESVFDSIAYGEHQIALLCAKALHERSPKLQPSQHMIVGALKASIRARTGYDGFVIDGIIAPTMKSFQQAVHTAKWWLQTQGFPPIGVSTISAKVVVESQCLPTVPPKPQKTPATSHSSTKKRAKSSTHTSRPLKKYSDAARSSPAQTTTFVTMPISFPIFVDPHLPPAPSFPPFIIQCLDRYLKNLILHNQTAMVTQCGAELNVVTKMNISELYSITADRSAHFKSPLTVLKEGLSKIGIYTGSSPTHVPKLPNEQMLALIDEIFTKDVALCAWLLGAFMEQQICIPLINTAKNTAETLSSQTAPVAVGVWALFSQSLATLKAKLESNNRSQLIIDTRQYIEGISQQLPEYYEDMMYAGKLQFLLQGLQQIVTASSQYISYSLERQLCNNLKFDRDMSLKDLINQWDKIFENDALSLVGESHRPLVARWLKWTVLIHDLRETLAQYTCIGVTGFVNSGKSLLVKKLFKIERVKIGVQAAKRTTVPLLYNLEDTVEGLDIIDFPGVDDTDHTIPDLARLLLSLAQIIIFVIDFKRAFSEPVKKWLQALTKNGVPIHVCLTHADMLYTECKAEDKLTNIEVELERIRTHFALDAQRKREIAFYSFHHASDITTDELQEWGINSAVHVGTWLVHVLKHRFKQEEIAEKLNEFLKSH